jgi:hypothetical protein
LAPGLSGIPLQLGSVGFFPSTKTAFLGVAPTEALLRAHMAVHRALTPLTAGRSPYYQSPRWQPHCTLARDALHAAAAVIEAIAGHPLPIHAQSRAVLLVRLPTPVAVARRGDSPPAAAAAGLTVAGDILNGLRPPPPPPA